MTRARFNYDTRRSWPWFWRRRRVVTCRPGTGPNLLPAVLRAKAVRHDNLLPIETAADVDGRLVVGYPLAPNMPLPRGPLSQEEVLRVVWDVSRALRPAHALNIGHGWLRPGCLSRTRAGRTVVAELGFGAEGDPTVDPEQLPYLAPERIGNVSDLSPSGDRYSLGAIAFELLTGRQHLPHPGDLNDRLRRADPPRVRTTRAEIGQPLDDLVYQMLQPDPGSRVPSTDELVRMVAATASVCNIALPPDTTPGAGRPWESSTTAPDFKVLVFDSESEPADLAAPMEHSVLVMGQQRGTMELRKDPGGPRFAVYAKIPTGTSPSPYTPASASQVDEVLNGLADAVEQLHALGARLHLGFWPGEGDAGSRRLATTLCNVAGGPALYGGVERWTFGNPPLRYPLKAGWLDGWRTLFAGGWRKRVLANLLASIRAGDAVAPDDWRGVIQLAFYLRTAAAEGAKDFNKDGVINHAKRVLPWVNGERSALRRALFPPYADILNWDLGLTGGYPGWNRWAGRVIQRLRAR